LSVREVAAHLGISRATVYRLCDDGRLPHARIGQVIRIRVCDLDTFVQGQG
jgi:excisionase family DNA binding protein